MNIYIFFSSFRFKVGSGFFFQADPDPWKKSDPHLWVFDNKVFFCCRQWICRTLLRTGNYICRKIKHAHGFFVPFCCVKFVKRRKYCTVLPTVFCILKAQSSVELHFFNWKTNVSKQITEARWKIMNGKLVHRFQKSQSGSDILKYQNSYPTSWKIQIQIYNPYIFFEDMYRNLFNK